jgi:outer membrane protein assembly factor BamB
MPAPVRREKMGTGRPNPRRAATRLRSLLLLLVAASLLIPSTTAVQPTEDEWPQFRGWDTRVGTSPSSIPDTNETLWSIDLPDQVQSSVSIVDGKALVGCDDGNLYCLDADTGGSIWQFETANVVQSTPLVSNGRVYFGSADRHGYCLDLESGAEIWSIESNQIVSSPALWNDMVYFTDQWGFVYAVDAEDGTEVWNHTLPLDIWATPTVIAGRLYVGDIGGNYVCLDATTGDEVWNRSFAGGEVYSTAMVHNGRVLIGTGIGMSLECMDAATGDTIWTFAAEEEIYSSVAVVGDLIYVHAWPHLWCLPWDDPDGDGTILPGDAIWTFKTHDEQGGSSPVVAGDRLVVGSDIGRLFCLDTATGEQVWNLSMPAFVYASPAVAGGRVYVGSTAGRLVCVGTPSQPRLYTTLIPERTEVFGGEGIKLDVTVLDGAGLPGGDAFMQYSATHGTLQAEFGTVVEGAFDNYWTAPDVATTTYVTITATGELPGLEVVPFEVQIAVEPAEDPPAPDVPTISHPYLLAGVIGMLVLIGILAVLIVKGRRKAREVVP